jgi:hypothetical protein
MSNALVPTQVAIIVTFEKLVKFTVVDGQFYVTEVCSMPRNVAEQFVEYVTRMNGAINYMLAQGYKSAK